MAVKIEIIRQLVECFPQAGPYDVPDEELLCPGDLPMDRRIEYEERAAILEYDGGMSRDKADIKAFQEILNRRQFDTGAEI